MFSPKKPTVTIGIPAYNEAANIVHLLRCILAQETGSFILEKVIVVSDGSSDATASLVRAVSDPRIILIDDGARKGQAPRQNEIIRATRSDILVLLNADILLEGNDYVDTLIEPILRGQAEFVSGKVTEVTPRTLVERILHAGEIFKRDVFGKWKDGGNLFTCVGRARAFSRKYYTQIHFPKYIGEDMYSYFFGLQRGLRYQYVPQAVVKLKLSETLQDYFRQTARFVQAKNFYVDEFGDATVKQQYEIPRGLFVQGLFHTFFREPLYFTLYIGLYMVSRFESLLHKPITYKWDTSVSSKKLKE